jgi:hypothetical protein
MRSSALAVCLFEVKDGAGVGGFEERYVRQCEVYGRIGGIIDVVI